MTQGPPLADHGDSLKLEAVAKRYGPVLALNRVSLSVRRGEFLTILGPSGSGKTTLLKIVAGFELPDQGTVHLGDRDITFARPAARNIGMVFQNYALFPHMTVAENIGFPLRMRRAAREEIRRRVDTALALVELSGFEKRMPDQLSGGQQQRVALARALVFDPPLLLLDEPFGALDRKLRDQMQLEVKRLQRRLGVTTIFVTHDQEEALLLSDRIAVMSQGEIQQVADPESLYDRPGNRFIAEFIGESNLLAAKIVETGEGRCRARLAHGGELRIPDGGMRAGEEVHLVIRPESPRPVRNGMGTDNVLTAEVTEAIFTGQARKYRLCTPDGLELLVRWPCESDNPALAPGDRLRIAIPWQSIHVVS